MTGGFPLTGTPALASGSRLGVRRTLAGGRAGVGAPVVLHGPDAATVGRPADGGTSAPRTQTRTPAGRGECAGVPVGAPASLPRSTRDPVHGRPIVVDLGTTAVL
ncbi:hypothetical protein QE410_001276 [Microbacterium sp. SORGH_AS 1204]|uniref:hypothetical protein n=1 Tax=Microbacterium sp. SORGH_AS_1204 TaxID=3041785 RepID=UPI0027932D08|nr:hypothetical protein [Microbacterium sp. SORGH_AS_1204]MDQ1136477.1 hypothetical protein [Microbacterium sp. SORGH_AS_1204]